MKRLLLLGVGCLGAFILYKKLTSMDVPSAWPVGPAPTPTPLPSKTVLVGDSVELDTAGLYLGSMTSSFPTIPPGAIIDTMFMNVTAVHPGQLIGNVTGFGYRFSNGGGSVGTASRPVAYGFAASPERVRKIVRNGVVLA